MAQAIPIQRRNAWHGWRRAAAAAWLVGATLAQAQTAASTSPVAPAAVPSGATVRLVFAGDVMLDDGPGRVIAEGRDPLALFDTVLRDSDYTIGNLECPIATTGQALDNKIYNFRAAPTATRVLQGRFQAMGVANNHSGDYGQTAFLETLEHLQVAGIHSFGGGRNLSEAHRPLWIEKHGIRIAVLAYNEFKPRRFEAGPDWPGVAWSEDEQVVADIRAARRAGADWVIPFLHWGWEREPEPSDRQRQFARTLIDAGADIVVGGHPHITQGVESYKGKPIVYSLGNFVFDGFKEPALREGWVLRLTLDKRHLLAWDTRLAQMDDEGTPHPQPGALTPCGKPNAWGPAGEPGECVNP